MVRLLARVIGVGIEMAEMLVQEVLSRNMRAGFTTPALDGRGLRDQLLARPAG
jgi:hypothetical protein